MFSLFLLLNFFLELKEIIKEKEYQKIKIKKFTNYISFRKIRDLIVVGDALV